MIDDNQKNKWNLRKVRAEDYELLKQYFSLRDAETCESVITDTYLWKLYYRTQYFLTETGLNWIYQTDTEIFTGTPLCKTEHLQDNLQQLLFYFHEVLHQKLVMYLVDEAAVKAFDLPQELYHVEEERMYFDYVYDAEELRTLPGKKYHKKKNHLNAFLNTYQNRFQSRRLDGHDVKAILDFVERWHGNRNIDDPYHRDDYEVKGIAYMLQNCNLIKYEMYGVFVDGQMEAFSLGTYDSEKRTAYIHVEKANPDIRGLYPYINQHFLMDCFPDARYVNREDDMGLEGLRKAKLSYHPVYLVKKYMIREL